MPKTRKSKPGGDTRPFPGFEDLLSFMGSMREERMALVVFVAAVAGDDLDEAIERTESVLHTFGENDLLSISPDRRWRDIAMRTQVIAEAVLHDLKQVRDHERKKDGAAEETAGKGKAQADDERGGDSSG